MEYNFKYKLPINVGDILYGFYREVYEHKVDMIEINASLKRPTDTGELVSTASWKFKFENSSSYLNPEDLGSDYFKSKLDLKKWLLNSQKTQYNDILEVTIPIKYDIGTKIYAIDGNKITEYEIWGIKLDRKIYANKGGLTKIEYKVSNKVQHTGGTVTSEDFGKCWDIDKERLINKILEL